MKIAVSAAGPSLDELVDPRFGRCACFLIVETDTLEFEAIENASKNLSGGAGIEAAQRVADRGVTHVLTGNCGPNAEKVLSAAGIRIISGRAGTVREAVERFGAGETIPAEKTSSVRRPGSAPVQSRPPDGVAPGRSAGFGGRGAGRGMGKGRGMGRRCGM
jgi:predicted Fe-Mo cluster-binding NifX family protein